MYSRNMSLFTHTNQQWAAYTFCDQVNYTYLHLVTPGFNEI